VNSGGNPAGQFILTEFTKYTDINGTVVFPSMSKGTYSFTVRKVGYDDYNDIITINTDTTIIVQVIDTTTGIATFMTEAPAPYPNPTSDKINVSIPANLKLAVISVIGINGALIRSSAFAIEEGIVSVDLQGLPTGQYFIKVSGKEYQKVWVVTKK
jgi:hypothetical protein